MADERAQIALNDLYQVVEYAIPFGAGGEYPELRDRLVGLELTVEQSAKLAELDALAIDIAVTFDLDDLWPGLLKEHPNKPLERWWWHLGAIRRGEYPLDRLPGRLRQVVDSVRSLP